MNLNKLEFELNYTFKDKKLLKQALTHSSYTHESQLDRIKSNERLEFLGDAILELVSSEYLFKKYKDKPEGELTKIRAKLVCESSLFIVANKLNISKYILLGKGENNTGGRQRPSILSDALEAIMGAVYLDGGFASAKDFILNNILDNIEYDEIFYDSKTILQEIVQSEYNIGPNYKLISETGPDHNKEFEVLVEINGKAFAKAKGSSKKSAESKAAALTLKKLGKV